MSGKIKFFSKMKVIKSVMNLSFYKILINDFSIKSLSKNIHPKLRIPIKKYFEEQNFYYEFDWPSMTLYRYNNLLNHFILFILLLNIIRNLFYTFMNSNDQMLRLYFGDLIQFVSHQTSFISIALTGISCFGTSMFCLFHYTKLDHLKWLKVFNSIEGSTNFVSNKISIFKSAKKFIRFSLILLALSASNCYMTTFTCAFVFLFFCIEKLRQIYLLLYAFPWIIINTIWAFYCSGYINTSWFISIVCYYYKLRLNQLNVNLCLLLKRKQFSRINQYIDWLLHEYLEIMNEIHDLNKFVSKVILFFFIFEVSTMVFLIYNLIYVKLSFVTSFGHQLVVCDILLTLSLIIINAIKIPNQFDENKRNLIKLMYDKKLAIKNKMKVKNEIY